VSRVPVWCRSVGHLVYSRPLRFTAVTASGPKLCYRILPSSAAVTKVDTVLGVAIAGMLVQPSIPAYSITEDIRFPKVLLATAGPP
jgi:hypothetical protein